jgi:uncharacterized repeat protein (TIGR03803 family)
MRASCVAGREIRNKLFIATVVFSTCFCDGKARGAAQDPFDVIHSFAGSPNDGGSPTYGTSLGLGGSTLYGVTQYGGTKTNGVLFKVNGNGSGYIVLHVFNGTNFLNPTGSKNDGALPTGTPVVDGTTVYGMTVWGGSNGFGTIYRINPDGSGFQILHHFSGVNDGTFPQGSLVLSGSTLYGMTSSGGNISSQGTLFRIETNGTGYRLLHNFAPGATDGAATIGSPLVLGSRVYGMAQFGGSLGSGVLWAVNTNGTGYQLLHTFTGTVTDGSLPYGSLVSDGTDLYGMTSSGGANNVGTVFRIGTNGMAFQILHNFALNEGWSPFGDVTLVGSKLYGMTHSGGAGGLGGGVIFEMGLDGSGYQVLHTFNVAFDGSNGMVPFGSLTFADSSLFGMTSQGGSKFQGCVFAYRLNGSSGGGGTAQLGGGFNTFKEVCKTKRGVLGCTLTAFLTLQNTGTAASVPTHLRYFLSGDGAFDAGADIQFGEKKWPKIKPGKSKKLRVKAKTTASTIGSYILAVDDAGSVLGSAQIPPAP